MDEANLKVKGRYKRALGPGKNPLVLSSLSQAKFDWQRKVTSYCKLAESFHSSRSIKASNCALVRRERDDHEISEIIEQE